MWLLVLALALLGICCSGEESGDISGCCTHLAVTRWVLMVIDMREVVLDGSCSHLHFPSYSEGSASEHQANRLGEYKLTGVLADRPIYKNEQGDEFLFYLRVRCFCF